MMSLGPVPHYCCCEENTKLGLETCCLEPCTSSLSSFIIAAVSAAVVVMAGGLCGHIQTHRDGVGSVGSDGGCGGCIKVVVVVVCDTAVW